MFMTDDHGAWATGAYGCGEMHTPNIDRLAAGGARFTRAFACTPVCSPSRMTYMTGTHSLSPRRAGLASARRQLRRRRATAGSTAHPTYSEVLARNGYTLGMCGKWHMGEDDKRAGAASPIGPPCRAAAGTYRDPEFVHERRASDQ